MLTVGSLFSGIGGFDYGLGRAGMRVVWQCEQDKFCRRVLAHHWPDVPCYPDIKQFRTWLPEPVDVLCGGFPCQDISVAGRGAGIDGERSGLWAEYARLIGELRPSYVIVENVAALLARGLGRVLGDLAACGYDAEWDCIPACAVGAPHRRDRVWLVAYPGGARRWQNAGSAPSDEATHERWTPEDDHVADSHGQSRGTRPLADALSEGELQPQGREREVGRRIGDSRGEGAHPDAHGERRQGRSGQLGTLGRDEPADVGEDSDSGSLEPWRVRGRVAQAGGSEWWAIEPPVGRVAHGVPDRLDQLAALGNALVPQIAEWIGRRIIEWEGGVA